MRGSVILVLLGLSMDVTGQIMIQLIPQNPVVKGSVTLNVTGIPESLLRFSWFKGPTTSSQYQILVYIPGIDPPTVPGPQNNPRISFFSNGSLHIRDLQVTDQGNYTVNIQTQKIAKDVFVNLTVHESPDNTQDHVPVYENVLAEKPKEESSYMGLQFRSEETYTELKTRNTEVK
ncbi:cell adhesion molecule CEACAM19-like [Leptodactylus fuscus]|uniref:cell adhesion molecule CEACAM19-like n=1 Tax=Leptodactylus fuscus TaxID=238119 RepID=UPI003F4E8CE1